MPCSFSRRSACQHFIGIVQNATWVVTISSAVEKTYSLGTDVPWAVRYIQVYKILTNIDTVKIDTHLTLHVGQTRGHPRKLYKDRHRTNLTQNTFSNRVVDAWNTLPEEVVMAPSLNSFKSRLNKAWKYHPLKFSPSCYN